MNGFGADGDEDDDGDGSDVGDDHKERRGLVVVACLARVEVHLA